MVASNPPPTRELRGLKLFRDHAGEIETLGKGRYTVPGCSSGTYTVNLAVFGGEESCTCPDHARHPEYSCKHLVAATIFRAKRRGEAHRANGSTTGGEDLSRQPRPTGGGTVRASVRAIAAGLILAAPFAASILING